MKKRRALLVRRRRSSRNRGNHQNANARNEREREREIDRREKDFLKNVYQVEKYRTRDDDDDDDDDSRAPLNLSPILANYPVSFSSRSSSLDS